MIYSVLIISWFIFSLANGFDKKIPMMHIDCSKRAAIVESNVFEVSCPADCHLHPYRIWGKYIYKMDSNICVAAIHAGKVDASVGGVVYVKKTTEYHHYNGSRSHGVRSLSYPVNLQRRGFTIETEKDMLAKKLSQTSCKLRGSDFRPSALFSSNHRNKPYTYCPVACLSKALGKGKKIPLWGDRFYASNSFVCLAAAHRGLLYGKKGEWIQVRRGPLLFYFHGSKAKHTKITSNSMTGLFFSFTVQLYRPF